MLTPFPSTKRWCPKTINQPFSSLERRRKEVNAHCDHIRDSTGGGGAKMREGRKRKVGRERKT